MRTLIPLSAALLLAACAGSDTDQDAANGDGGIIENAAGADGAIGADAAPPAPRVKPDGPLASELTLQRWKAASNKAGCAPLGLLDDGGAGGKARKAEFAGGWGIAFDTPIKRSAYGVAGAGIELADFGEEVTRIHDQWPYVRPLGGRAGGLPGGTIAGYGLDGAGAFADDNPDGRGEKLGAYVIIPGQRCLYNLWSELGRAHLETMLDNLTLLKTTETAAKPAG